MIFVIDVTENNVPIVFNNNEDDKCPRKGNRRCVMTLGAMSFGIILLVCLVPTVIAVLATEVDEEIAMHGGFHKIHH